MSFEKISKLLKGDTPGRSVELHYSRIGPDDTARRCIGQKQIRIPIDISQSSLSQHLSKLRNQGNVNPKSTINALTKPFLRVNR